MISSEAIEPHVVQLIDDFLFDLGAQNYVPNREYFQTWNTRFSGVSMLLSLAESHHALLALDNFRGRLLNAIADEHARRALHEVAQKVMKEKGTV